MNDRIAALQSICRSVVRWAMAGVMAVAILSPLTALPSFADSGVSRQLIPILGLTTDEHAVGTVAYLALSFEERSDHSGLMVHFQNGQAGSRGWPRRPQTRRFDEPPGRSACPPIHGP